MNQYTEEKLIEYGVSKELISKRDLTDVILTRRNLAAVDLKGFILTRINLEQSILTGADLRGLFFTAANCVNASLTGADLRGANLALGYFQRADFRGADLRGAHIADSICNECSFAGADLRGAHLGNGHYDSDFRGADLRGATINDIADFNKLNCDIRGALLTPNKIIAVQNMRREPRVHLLPRLRIFDRTTQKEIGILSDITRGGIRITSDRLFAVDTTYFIQVLLPEGFSSGTALNLNVRSVWSSPASNSGYCTTGFRIEDATDETTRIISELIREYGKNEMAATMA